MSFSATFEVATLADAVQKAAIFQASKGSGFDKAGGIVIEVAPMVGARIRATDLNVTFDQNVATISVAGDSESATWRVPALLSTVLSKIPIVTGATVTLSSTDGDPNLHIISGKSKGRLKMFDASLGFPEWDRFDVDGLGLVENLPAIVQRIVWAADEKFGVLGGICIDGEWAYATDKNVAAKAPLTFPHDDTFDYVTVPVQMLHPVISKYPELHVGVAENKLLVGVDQDTQLTVNVFGDRFPIDGMRSFFSQVFTHAVSLDRDTLLGALDRLAPIGGTDSMPRVRVSFNADGTLDLSSTGESGKWEDTIDIVSDGELKTAFKADYLKKAVGGANAGAIRIHHNAKALNPVKITDGSGYEALVMAIKDI